METANRSTAPHRRECPITESFDHFKFDLQEVKKLLSHDNPSRKYCLPHACSRFKIVGLTQMSVPPSDYLLKPRPYDANGVTCWIRSHRTKVDCRGRIDPYFGTSGLPKSRDETSTSGAPDLMDPGGSRLGGPTRHSTCMHA